MDRTNQRIRISVFVAAFAVITLSGCNSWSPLSATEPEKVEFCSMINLIATPEKYDGKRIRTQGFAQIGLKSGAIYLSSEDEKHQVGINGIQLVLEGPVRSEHLKERTDLKWVLVEGVYHRKEEGLFWAGYINEISLLYAPEDVESE